MFQSPRFPSDQQLKAVHIETYGKTGCRRIVPGQYLAADPQGRAIMISAVEKQKLVRDPVSAVLQLSHLTCSKLLDVTRNLRAIPPRGCPHNDLLKRFRANPQRILP